MFVWRVRLYLLALAVGLIGVEADRGTPIAQAIQPAQPSPVVVPLAALPVKDEPVQVGSAAVSRSLSQPERARPRMAVAQSSDPHCSGRAAKSHDSQAARKSTKPQKSNGCKPSNGVPADIKAGVSHHPAASLTSATLQ